MCALEKCLVWKDENHSSFSPLSPLQAVLGTKDRLLQNFWELYVSVLGV